MTTRSSQYNHTAAQFANDQRDEQDLNFCSSVMLSHSVAVILSLMLPSSLLEILEYLIAKTCKPTANLGLASFPRRGPQNAVGQCRTSVGMSDAGERRGQMVLGPTGFSSWTIAEVVGYSKEVIPLGMTMGRYRGRASVDDMRAYMEAIRHPTSVPEK
jgi:hypothetical protein